VSHIVMSHAFDVAVGPLATRVGYDPGLESETFHQRREPRPLSGGVKYRPTYRDLFDEERIWRKFEMAFAVGL